MLCRKCNERPIAPHNLKRHNYACNHCNNKRDRDKVRNQLLDHYGRACVYCGAESDLEFDHTNGDGSNDHRGSRHSWLRSLIANGFPTSCQVVCRQCNAAKRQMTDQQFREWIAYLYYRIYPKDISSASVPGIYPASSGCGTAGP